MRIGLALGSGGLRGAAHVGVISEFERAGIRPHMVAGSSAGSIVAAMHALGMTAAEMERIALSLKVRDLVDPVYSALFILALPVFLLLVGLRGRLPRGLLRGQSFERLLHQVFGDTLMSELPLDCAVTTVDITTGDKVVFTSVPVAASRFKQTVYRDGRVVDAVRASCSIPGVFVWKEWQGRKLVDGAVREPVPARVLAESGCDFVIAVDLGFGSDADGNITDLSEVVSQSLDVLGEEVSDYVLHQYADVVVAPRVGSASLTQVHRIPEFIEAGRQAARAAVPDIRKALSRKRLRRARALAWAGSTVAAANTSYI